MSWMDGYECYSTSDIDSIAGSSDPAHPLLILLAHDGDNAFGGGYSYYKQCVRDFVNEGQGKVCQYSFRIIYTLYATVCILIEGHIIQYI